MVNPRKEIVRLLEEVRPFNQLPAAELKAVSEQFVPQRFERNETITAIGEHSNALQVIVSGAVDILDSADVLYARKYERECFGSVSLIENEPATHCARAFEDVSVLRLSGEEFHRLCRLYTPFHEHFLLAEAQRLHAALRKVRQSALPTGMNSQLSVTAVGRRDPALARATISIEDAARIMQRQDSSCLLFVDEQGLLAGIVTDKDLRNRVLAKTVSPEQPVSQIMTPEAITIDHEQKVFEADLEMMRNNVHHLPVVDQGRPIALLTSSDLLQVSRRSPLHTSASIFHANSVVELVSIADTIPELFCQLVENGLEARQVAHYLSSIGENLTSRLCKLAELELGSPPVPYAWLAAGSLGRREQLLQSDQDNALLLSDDYDASLHGDYFSSLSQFVSDGLNDCHYDYCTGNIMATNEQWKQPLSVWKQYFHRWVCVPKATDLLYCSIFFDLRVLHGEAGLLDELRSSYLSLAKESHPFLAQLFMNTLQHTPPIGFFRRFVLLKDEEHRSKLNLKNRGTGPIVDLARSLSIAAGSVANNTHNRLIQAGRAGLLTEDTAGSLMDAHEFINRIRLRHQSEQVRSGLAPDNFADPEQLNSFERDHLRDAFRIVAKCQEEQVKRYRLYLSG